MRVLGKRSKAWLERLFRTGLDSASDEQAEQAASQSRVKISKLEDSGIPDSLEGIWQEIRLLYGMINDSVRGRYTLPYRSIGAIAFTLLYFVNPFDLISDVIPIVGYIDDAFVLGLCFKFIGADLEKYRDWIHHDSIEIQKDETEK